MNTRDLDSLSASKFGGAFKQAEFNGGISRRFGDLLNFITTPNCALDRSKFLCLYVPGFQRQVLKYVPRFKWIPQTKSPHSYTCNVNFVGTFVLLRIPQQANIASCSGLGNCKWIPQNVSRIRKGWRTTY